MLKSFLLFVAAPLLAEDALSLREAVRLALKENRAVAAANAGVSASEARVEEARAGKLPKLNYSESYTRSNNPVFVFGSLLTQHQFGPENFDIGTLNRPGSLNNFQSLVTVDQNLYDAGQTRNTMKSAGLSHQMTQEEQRRTRMQVISGVVRAYYRVVLGAESLKAAEQALRSAEADLKRAESVRAAGMSTDVDVLSIRVHLASVTEQRIQRAAELDVAKSALNDALGLPLDTGHILATPLAPLDLPDLALASFEQDASAARPEARQTRIAADLAKVQSEAVRSALLPQVTFHGAFEADRQQFINKGGANWLASLGLHWNLFNGGADKARIEESTHWMERAHADEQRVDSAVRLEVRRAWADLRAAQQRIEVAKAAMAEAEESLRITQNRYEAGMSNVTDLLRNETAVLESRTRYLAAVHDQRLAATMLELAAGRLSPDSEVLN
ncbi:MAG TPA: TolC family protein [Candidatus Acidoferrales bacterium]|nr:TolC family protein [Candidatus Acidoferrales bacterium]